MISVMQELIQKKKRRRDMVEGKMIGVVCCGEGGMNVSVVGLLLTPNAVTH